MLNFQIKERLDFILLCLLFLVRHQVLSEYTSHHTPSQSHNEGVTWNGWPDTKDVSEITALVDYTTGLVFYKDTSVPACFVENKPNTNAINTPSTLPKVLAVTNHLHRISDSDGWADSVYKHSFCGSLPIYKIETLEEQKLKRGKRLPRKKRQTNGGISGSQAQASQWPSSSQTQVQGSVAGRGFFSGQAQAAHGGYSQSQVQLGGQGITGNLQSSAGNAQSQLSLGEEGGAGQASSFGVGPSNSQVQVNLGQREQGSHAMANVFQQHAYDQGDYSKQAGNGYGTRQRDTPRFSTYPVSGYGNGQRGSSQAGVPLNYQQGSGGGSTFSGQPLSGVGSGGTRNGYSYPSSGTGQLPSYSQPQYSQPQHTSYSNGRASSQLPQQSLSGYDSQSLTGHGSSLGSHGQGLTSHGQSLTGHGQGLTGTGQGLTGHGQGLTGTGQGLTGNGQSITGHGQSSGIPIQGQPQPQSGSGYGTSSLPGSQGILPQPGGLPQQPISPITPPIQLQSPQTGSGYIQPSVTQPLYTGSTGRGGQSTTGANGQSHYPQVQPQHSLLSQRPATSPIVTQDRTGTHGTYDTSSYTPTSSRDGDSGRQSQNQGIYINSNVQPLNGHGQQVTQNGDHRRRHEYQRGGNGHGASAGAGGGYGAYATAPGGQAQAQSLHIGSFGTNGHDYSGYRKPYYSTAPQGSTIQDGSHSTQGTSGGYGGGGVSKNGYTNGYTNGHRTSSQGSGVSQTGKTTGVHGTGNGYTTSIGSTSGHTQTGQTTGVHGTGNGYSTSHTGTGHAQTGQSTSSHGAGNGYGTHTGTNGYKQNGHSATLHGTGNGYTAGGTNGHKTTGTAIDQGQPGRPSGTTDQELHRRNGGGVSPGQSIQRNGNGHGYGTTSTTTFTNGSGYRNGHSVSVNGYSSGNGHRGTTNGHVPQHQQPQYSHRQSGTNGNGVSHGPSSSQKPQCTVITFTCTIVIESNGRAKLCRPKSTSTPNTGANGSGVSGNTDQMVCCC